MSEAILKALTQLFAIITKQDGGATKVERDFVIKFFTQELDQESVAEYEQEYERLAEYDEDKDRRVESKLTSVKDSVVTLKLCRQINKTLDQKQKAIVLVRLLELVSADKNFTAQRRNIIDTVANVFSVSNEEYKLLDDTILAEKSSKLEFEDLLVVTGSRLNPHVKSKHFFAEQLAGEILFFHIKSVDMYFLRYLGTEQLSLNGQNIKAQQVYLFSHGSILKLPKSSPIYYSDVVGFFVESLKTTPLSFEVKNIEFKFGNGAIGLRNINISEGPGKLIGIMGGSGAGKTTLLNVLAGLEKPTQGEALINGKNIHTDRANLEGIIGYISQDDILIEDLTVYDNLFYNAQLCFKNLSEEELDKRVMEVLQSLGLDHIKDLKVGSILDKKISGGQRKRLNIALELIREPAVMFVDEPTSGLSSRDSENVVDLLKELSLKGKLIFVVIHQPSSEIYKMFDKMFILDIGGYPIYYGNPIQAVVYFKEANKQVDSQRGQCPTCGNVNPEQIFNIIEAKVVTEYGTFTNRRKMSPIEWHERFQAKIPVEPIQTIKEAPPKALDLPSRFKQMSVFITRDFFAKISNTQYLFINLLEAPVLAFLLAFIIRYQNDPEKGTYSYRYNDNIPAYILVGVLVAIFMGLTVSAEEIIRDRKIQKRESFLNLSRTAYLFSKIGILFTLSGIQTLSFVLIGNTILEIQGMTLSYWLVFFSLSCFANMLGLNISSSFNSVVTIYITIPLLIIPQMILSGLIFNFDKLNSAIGNRGTVPIVADIIASRWGFEALAVQQFKQNKFQQPYYLLEKEASKSFYKATYEIPELEEHLEEAMAYKSSAASDSLKKLVMPRRLILLKNTFKNEDYKNLPIDIETDLEPERFNMKIGEKLRTYLETSKKFYSDRFNKADDIREADIAKREKEDKTYNLTTYKNLYYNEALADIVKNNNVKQKIFEDKTKLIQQTDPIFHDPIADNILDYRSHFLAPQKNMFGLRIDTFYFNILVIWFMCVVLYVTLYFESFKWIVESLGKIKFRFAEKAYESIRKQVEDRRAEADAKRKRLEAEKLTNTNGQMAKV